VAIDVFICHSSQDRDRVIEICESLERSGMTCWMAPRNVPAGAEWPAAISQAISDCLLVLVVLSEKSIESNQVGREIGNAAERGKTIIPYRLDASPLSGIAAYYLSSVHHIDGTEADAVCLEILSRAVRKKLNELSRTPVAVSVPTAEPEPAPRPTRALTTPVPVEGVPGFGSCADCQVVVCYAAEDDGEASAVFGYLVRYGLRGYMHPDDTSGKLWALEMKRAMETTKAVVFVMSEAATVSARVERIALYANLSNKPVYEYRLANFKPTEALKRSLPNSYVIEAWKAPPEIMMRRLFSLVSEETMRVPDEHPSAPIIPVAKTKPLSSIVDEPKRKTRFGAWFALASLSIVAAGAGYVAMNRESAVAQALTFKPKSKPKGKTSALRAEVESAFATAASSSPVQTSPIKPVAALTAKLGEQLKVGDVFDASLKLVYSENDIDLASLTCNGTYTLVARDVVGGQVSYRWKTLFKDSNEKSKAVTGEAVWPEPTETSDQVSWIPPSPCASLPEISEDTKGELRVESLPDITWKVSRLTPEKVTFDFEETLAKQQLIVAKTDEDQKGVKIALTTINHQLNRRGKRALRNENWTLRTVECEVDVATSAPTWKIIKETQLASERRTDVEPENGVVTIVYEMRRRENPPVVTPSRPGVQPK